MYMNFLRKNASAIIAFLLVLVSFILFVKNVNAFLEVTARTQVDSGEIHYE